MNVTPLPLDLIDVGTRLRGLDPAWVSLLAEQIAEDGQKEPVRVFRRCDRFVLIAGAYRVAAHIELGRSTIAVSVETEEAYRTEASVKLAEIKSNMMRSELTVLDRAIYVTTWRDIYLGALGRSTRGRKPKKENSPKLGPISTGAANDDQEDPFVLSLTEAAKRALGLAKMALTRALKIASIDAAAAEALVGLPTADNQSELLFLAEQTPQRQKEIVDLLVHGSTIGDAIQRLDGVAAPAKPSPYERIHQTFARLPEPQQHAFFDLNAEAIERWQAAKSAKPRARRVA